MLIERDQEFDTLHGVEAEVEFEVVGRVEDSFLSFDAAWMMPSAWLTCGLLHPFGFFGRELRAGALAGGLSAFSAFDALLDFEALDLASAGAGQVVLPDLVAEDALGRGHFSREAFDFEAQHVANVDDFGAAQRFEVRHDDAVEALGEWLAGRALQPDDADFFYVGRLQVVGLDFFGINVLAVAEDDEVFLASGDEEVAGGVGVAEVAAAEPSVAIHGGGGVGALVVSGHDDAAAKGDFADAGSAVFGRGLAIEDLHFVAG